MNLEQRIQKELAQLKQINRFRELKITDHLIDFSSNDYLGLASNPLSNKTNLAKLGSTGSRLISGNFEQIEKLEKEMALFFNVEAALIFTNGYLANMGLLSALVKRNDIIIYDQLIHASLRDGIQLSKSKNYSFSHNDVNDLEKKLQIATSNRLDDTQVFVVIESVYSMDGDSPDLISMEKLCSKYSANCLVDEAHALGTVGNKGEGLVQLLSLESKITARVFTFGKALGCDGAVVLGSDNLRNYLINTCRSFIYSTAPSPLKIESIHYQWNKLTSTFSLNEHSQHLKKHLLKKIEGKLEVKTGEFGNIVMVIIKGNEYVKKASNYLNSKGMDVRAILSPTVPEGSERLRICIHEFNTLEEIDLLANELINFTKTSI